MKHKMTYAQFMRKLRKFRGQFRLAHRLFDTTDMPLYIRRRNTNQCPIEAVAGVVVYHYYDGAEQLGLTYDQCTKIMNAADFTADFSLRIRNQMLRALGLDKRD